MTRRYIPALVSAALTLASPACVANDGEDAQAKPVSAKAVAKPKPLYETWPPADVDYETLKGGRFGGGSGNLAPYFPHVEVRTRSSFAHDHGMMTKVEEVMVNGKKVEEPHELLAAIVSDWKGWGPDGQRSDADIKSTASHFVDMWGAVHDAAFIPESAAPAHLISAAKGGSGDPVIGNRAPSPSEGKSLYQPPSAVIYTLRGKRLVVVTRFVQGHVGRRGQTWTYAADAFWVEDGKRYYIQDEDPLPHYAYATDRP